MQMFTILKTSMQESINTIIISILGITYGVIELLRRKKNKKSKLDGIEKLSKEIERLKHEKIKEQKRVVKERSDILFSEFQEIFCEKLNLSSESKEAIYYKALILDSVRGQTDAMMHEVIYNNNLPIREGRAWQDYKEQKFKYILTEIIKYITKIYKDELIGVTHEQAIIKCREDITRIYYDQIEEIFEEIKNMSDEYTKQIKSQQKVLEDLKNGKKK